MPYTRILAKIEEARWAIMPGALRGIIRAVQVGLTAEDYELFHRLTEEERTALVADLGPRVPNTTSAHRQGNVGIIFVDGPIVPRSSGMSGASGLTSWQALTADFLALEKTPGIKTIVFLFDSPGGAITGTSDFAALVSQSKKRTIAYTYGMCASAAFWVAAACDERYSVDTGIVGGLGVYGTYRVDKADGSDGTTLEIYSTQTPNKRIDMEDPETVARLQATADDLADVFLGAVAAYMGTTLAVVNRDFGKGATMAAKPALKAGMIDGVARLADVIGGLKRGGRARPVRQTAAVQVNGGDTVEKIAAAHVAVQERRKRLRGKTAKTDSNDGRIINPAIAGNHKGDRVKMDPVLVELMAGDPAIANAIRALEAEAFAKGQQAGEQKMQARVEAAKPFLAEKEEVEGEEAASYGAPVRRIAMQVLSGKLDASALHAAVAAVDAVTEGNASRQAALESEAVGDIPPKQPVVPTGSGSGPGEWKGYMDGDEEFDAEVARVRKQKGLPELEV